MNPRAMTTSRDHVGRGGVAADLSAITKHAPRTHATASPAHQSEVRRSTGGPLIRLRAIGLRISADGTIRARNLPEVIDT